MALVQVLVQYSPYIPYNAYTPAPGTGTRRADSFKTGRLGGVYQCCQVESSTLHTVGKGGMRRPNRLYTHWSRGRYTWTLLAVRLTRPHL